MKKLLAIGLMLLSLIGLAGTVDAKDPYGNWIKDTYECMENGQKVYDWYWMSPVIQFDEQTIAMLISCHYTDYGRQLRNFPDPVPIRRSAYVVEINLATSQYRYFSWDRYDFNNNKTYSSPDYPGGTAWVTPSSGSMAARWIEVARSAPKARPDILNMPIKKGISTMGEPTMLLAQNKEWCCCMTLDNRLCCNWGTFGCLSIPGCLCK